MTRSHEATGQTTFRHEDVQWTRARRESRRQDRVTARPTDVGSSFSCAPSPKGRPGTSSAVRLERGGLRPSSRPPDGRKRAVGLSWQQGPLSTGAIGRFLVPEPLPKRPLYVEPLRRRL